MATPVPLSALPSVLPIVLGYSRFNTTTALCLDTLLPQAANLGTTVLAIDNGSPDGSGASLERYKNDLASPLQNCLLVIRHLENLGYGGGMNQAVKYGLTTPLLQKNGRAPEWLLLINSDTLFPPHTLHAWLAVLAAVPQNVGILAPLTNNAGNAQRIDLDVASKSSAASQDLDAPSQIKQEFQAWSGLAAKWIESPTDLIWPINRADFFCIAIRRSVWQELNGLDPVYGRGYFEDFDFSLRAIAAGYECALTDDCLIYHQGSASFKTNPEQKQLIRKNYRVFKNRFPKANMQHVRQSNLSMLQDQLAWLTKQGTSSTSYDPLLMRIKVRWQAALEDMPRSWFKRWRWKRGLIKIHQLYPSYLSKPNL